MKKQRELQKKLKNFLMSIKRRISIVLSEEIEPFIEKAKEISPDIKDVPYVALALKLNIAIWSNDKKLKEKQNVVKVYSTEEVMNL